MSTDDCSEKALKIRSEPLLRKYAIWLWFLLALFCLRVIGQMLVALFEVSFLPPMEEWQSGLIPYPWLLVSQWLIILLFGKVCIDFTRGHGLCVVPRKKMGHFIRGFSYLYFASMVLRYILTMALQPEQRWFGGTIPIFFHWVLAGFLFAFGHFHTRQDILR